MRTSTRILSITAAELAIGAGGFPFAQASQSAHGRMGGGMRGAGQPAVAATRMAAIKAELKITAAQEPAWQAFEVVVRQQADARQAIRTAVQARMQDPAAEASIDYAAQRETTLKLRESDQAVRDKAGQALYAVLSPEQKAMANQWLGAGADHRISGHRHAS